MMIIEEIIDGYLVRRHPSGMVERVLISDASPPSAPPRVLTHKRFRDLLSITEQLLLDNFNVAEYAAVEPKIQALTLVQRAFVRTALATYREAQDVDLDDEATVQLVSFFGAFALWDSPERAAKILMGEAP